MTARSRRMAGDTDRVLRLSLPAVLHAGAAAASVETALRDNRSGQRRVTFRLPPTADAYQATDALKATLEKDPPYGAQVEFKVDGEEAGWNAPAMASWLTASIDRASEATFGKPAAMMGEGGSIPFMGMLGKKFPRAQFIITGVLGPHSNAHGPNEFLHIPTGKKVSASVALVLADHFRQGKAA